MHFLGVDFGAKNIGLAVYKEGVDVVLPFGVVANNDEVFERLSSLLKEEKIEKVIVGLPLGLNGEENENTGRVKSFADRLSRESGVAVEFFDERFSSQAADRNDGGASRDEKAAMIILRDFLKK